MASNKKSFRQQIKDNDVFFCQMPWTMVFSEPEGYWTTCCYSNTVKGPSLKTTTPVEWMHSEHQQNLRKEMVDPNSDRKLIKEVCSRCIQEESRYGESRRLRKNRFNIFEAPMSEYSGDIVRSAEMFKATGEFEFDYRILELQVKVFGMECNIDCHMCHPRHSTIRKKTQLTDNKDASGQNLFKEIYLISDSFEDFQKYVDDVQQDKSKGQIDRLMELIPYTKTVKIIGGEPLVMKKQYEFLHRIIESGHSQYIDIKYQTNMTKLSLTKHRVIDLIPEFKTFFFTASLDSMGDAIEYCRRRTVWDELLSNCKALLEFPNVKIDVNSCMSFLSILRYHEFLEWVESDEGAQYINGGNPIPYALDYPPTMRVHNLPQKIKDNLIPKYAKWPHLQKMLMQPSDEFGTEENMQKLFKYLLENDKIYIGTKYEKHLFDVFPELEEFYKPDSTT